MKIAVIGASGRTGREVVAQALARDWSVVAASRSASFDPHPNLDVRRVDVHDGEAVRRALAGCDTVISALGVGSSRESTTTYSAGVTNLLTAMRDEGVSVLAAISAAPVGPRGEHPWFSRNVVFPILYRFFGASYEDMARMEALLDSSATPPSWLVLRPPRLVDRPARGAYRLEQSPIRGGYSITFGDLAAALLDAVERPEIHGRASYVAN